VTRVGRSRVSDLADRGSLDFGNADGIRDCGGHGLGKEKRGASQREMNSQTVQTAYDIGNLGNSGGK